MVSSIASSNLLFLSPYTFKDSNFSLSLVVKNPRIIRPRRTMSAFLSSSLVVKREKDLLGFLRCMGGGFVRRCKGWEETEGDVWALESEVLEFMQKSDNPENFPTKKELVDAGRMDLVEGILKHGGWLSLGWNLDDADEEKESVIQGDEFTNRDLIMDQECDSDGDEVWGLGVNSSHSASSSGRSLEMEMEDDTGIDGILSRLEKQRNITFGIDLREKGNSSTDTTVAGHDRSSRPASVSLNRAILNDSGSKLSQNKYFSNFDGSRNSLKPEMCRNWSIQRAGLSDTEFEAAEITFTEIEKGGATDTSTNEMLSIREDAPGPSDGRKELNSCIEGSNSNHIRTRLQHLELELTSALCLLKSKPDECIMQKGHESSSDDLQEVSDAWEFQENEIMNAQNGLRTIRAKLAVLQGKMALTITDAQKIVEEKQKKIDDARIALQLLRTACIVWPNSASEVLLSGSFDGWATQRKMVRSNTGIFSLCLKLYPGRYEIKFIVDGIWKIDPLRPIVHNNGYENNVLIIT